MRIRRVGKVGDQLFGDRFGALEIAVAHRTRQLFIEGRRRNLRFEPGVLKLVVTEEQADGEHYSGDHIAAVLGPPCAHLFYLFLF